MLQKYVSKIQDSYICFFDSCLYFVAHSMLFYTAAYYFLNIQKVCCFIFKEKNNFYSCTILFLILFYSCIIHLLIRLFIYSLYLQECKLILNLYYNKIWRLLIVFTIQRIDYQCLSFCSFLLFQTFSLAINKPYLKNSKI